MERLENGFLVNARRKVTQCIPQFEYCKQKFGLSAIEVTIETPHSGLRQQSLSQRLSEGVVDIMRCRQRQQRVKCAQGKMRVVIGLLLLSIRHIAESKVNTRT